MSRRGSLPDDNSHSPKEKRIYETEHGMFPCQDRRSGMVAPASREPQECAIAALSLGCVCHYRIGSFAVVDCRWTPLKKT
jgi:hypothetical protein